MKHGNIDNNWNGIYWTGWTGRNTQDDEDSNVVG